MSRITALFVSLYQHVVLLSRCKETARGSRLRPTHCLRLSGFVYSLDQTEGPERQLNHDSTARRYAGRDIRVCYAAPIPPVYVPSLFFCISIVPFAIRKYKRPDLLPSWIAAEKYLPSYQSSAYL